MLPTQQQLMKHLKDKLTNQDIATMYGTTFQKIIQLIQRNQLNPDDLRKVDKYIVYEHWIDQEVIYVGSGLWYRSRRYSNRRNSEHKELMKEGKLKYIIVGEFDNVKDARKYEVELIQEYKKINQAKYNKQVR